MKVIVTELSIYSYQGISFRIKYKRIFSEKKYIKIFRKLQKEKKVQVKLKISHDRQFLDTSYYC